MRRVLIVLALVCLVAPLSADRKKGMAMLSRPGQKAELAAPPAVVAKQRCGNWAWAAVFEAMLRMQGAGAPLDQTYWITRFNGGEPCLPSVGKWEDLERTLVHTYYVLDDGRKLRLEPRFQPGIPSSADALVIAMRQNQPLMLVWRGHAYLVAGVTYDEQIAPTGAHLIEITELKLMDPFAAPARPER